MDEKVIFRTETSAFYSPLEMKRIDKVIDAFYNYLRDSSSVELLWSDKVGYLLLALDAGNRKPAAVPQVIRSADTLVTALLDRIADDIAAEAGKRRLSRKEYPEYRRRVREFMAKLPDSERDATIHKCIRETLNKSPRTSWRKNSVWTALQKFEIRQYSCTFAPCQTKFFLANPHTLIYSAFP